MNSSEILRELIAFPTVSANPNRELIDFCADLLGEAGADLTILEDRSGNKANLYATIGDTEMPGVLLSGHTDVVPVEGQEWRFHPFRLTEANGKYYGRGTADMKGFVACALSAALRAARSDLRVPLHLALSYDEEIGCVGVRSMIDMLASAPFRPRFCIVGEPTSMAVATGHKGKTAVHVECTGREGHSALAPNALNAIYLATDVIGQIRNLQAEIVRNSSHDEAYEVPYSTLHVGLIRGGMALNIVPNQATFDFEIRNTADDDPDTLLANIRAGAEALVAAERKQFPEADINIRVTNRYPALSTREDSEVVDFVKSLTGSNTTMKVPFGTEGGLFSGELGIPTVICGPGSMDQGHKPDEFVSREQIERCDLMLETLVGRLRAGI